MPKHTKVSRKALFRAVLALNETSAQQWAASQGVTPSAVSLNLDGYRSGDDITAMIDGYIDAHRDRLAGALKATAA